MSDPIELTVTFSFDPASGLFTGALDNGTRFSVAPNNVSGKLGANLDLLRQFTQREKGGHAPQPHVAASRGDFGAARDARLVEEAIAAGRLQRVGIVVAPLGGHVKGRASALTLEDLGL